MTINSRSDGIVIAQIKVFEDGGYEFTGNTFVFNCGPHEVWDDAENGDLLDSIISIADKKFGNWQGFQVMGYYNTIHIK